MKTKEFRDLKLEDLNKKEAELRAELFNLQMQSGTSQLENPKRIQSVKRDVARILTLIKERALQERKDLEEAAQKNQKLSVQESVAE